jgi:hypothetical protein
MPFASNPLLNLGTCKQLKDVMEHRVQPLTLHELLNVLQFVLKFKQLLL